MIVTIDGPAGAGKSTIAKRLAEVLGFRFLDTGAMYRALTYHAQKSGVDLTSAEELEAHCLGVPLMFGSTALMIGDGVVGSEIRTPDVSRDVHYIADNIQIRRHLVDLQRQWVRDADFVSEGRDQGTVAFPAAECKFFLTATPETRARRRWRELHEQNHPSVYEEILAAQLDRDRRDQIRPEGRLLKAADAMTVRTDDLTILQVVDQLASIVRNRLALTGSVTSEAHDRPEVSR